MRPSIRRVVVGAAAFAGAVAFVSMAPPPGGPTGDPQPEDAAWRAVAALAAEEPKEGVEAAAPALDTYLKLNGIDGESQARGHEDEIDLLSWSWGTSQSGTTHMGRPDSGEAEAAFTGLTVEAQMSSASPLLAQAGAAGQVIPEAVLSVRRNGQTQDYIILKFKNVIVSSYSTSGVGHAVPVETIRLQHEGWEMQYRPTEPDGSLGAPVRASWSPRSAQRS